MMPANEISSLITSSKFQTEYQNILKKFLLVVAEEKIRIRSSLADEIKKIADNNELSYDAKIIKFLDVFISALKSIENSVGGKESNTPGFIKGFCRENFGVELGEKPRYRILSDGLMMKILRHQWAQENLLPPARTEGVSVVKSAPELREHKTHESKLSHSADDIGLKAHETKTLRKSKDDKRLGSMFGSQQFCFAEKIKGVEPGFTVVDLNEHFFQVLIEILSDQNLSKVQVTHRASLILLREQLQDKNLGLNQKQMIFASFVQEKKKEALIWLCEQVKEGVKNKNLTAWMYKLDYAEGGDRIDVNKKAIREFVGTRLARIFSEQNQEQEIVWVQAKKGSHALLACGWKNGLQELTEFLHGGAPPDYNGILVKDKTAAVKESLHIPGIAKNLIFGIAIGDRDGIGKDAQNKGFADGAFFGFDYGKPYERSGVCKTLGDDFSFEDPMAKSPRVFRGASFMGLARHFMYRNYSVFYDTALSERMLGFHLFRKMITGENPSEDVIKSYPGLRKELYRIEKSTPSHQELFIQLEGIKNGCKPKSQLEELVDAQIMELVTDKLTHFDLYFTKIKIDLMDMAQKHNLPFEELLGYIKFIDDMKNTARSSNENILTVFKARMSLTSQEIDLIDKLEKCFSPVSVKSHDGTVFLRTMRIEPKEERIPFQLRKEGEHYILTTSDATIPSRLKEEFGFEWCKKGKGLSWTLTPQEFIELTKAVEEKYNKIRKDRGAPDYEEKTSVELTPAEQLILRFKEIIDEELLKEISDIIKENSHSPVIQQLMQCDEAMLRSTTTIQAIRNDDLAKLSFPEAKSTEDVESQETLETTKELVVHLGSGKI